MKSAGPKGRGESDRHRASTRWPGETGGDMARRLAAGDAGRKRGGDSTPPMAVPEECVPDRVLEVGHRGLEVGAVLHLCVARGALRRERFRAALLDRQLLIAVSQANEQRSHPLDLLPGVRDLFEG